MISLMRKHAQSWVIKVLLGVIAVTFVISFGVGQFSASRQVLVRIGSDEITINEYNREYQQELDGLRRRLGDNAEAVANRINLRKTVYERMVNNRLMLNAARDRGLQVGDKEVNDLITSQAYFQIDNRFDFETYLAVLAQNRSTPESYEEQTRLDLLVRKYQRHLLAGMVVGNMEVDQRYRIQNEKVVVESFRMDPEAFRSVVKTDAKAEQAYYEANEERFTRPDQFKIDYFILSLAAVEAGVTLKERAIQRHYERFKDEQFSSPRRVRASHILKKLPKDASEEAVTKARVELQAVLEQAKAGRDFATLAKKHSEDLTKDKGGDLGYFLRGEMLPEFAGAAFALEADQVSGIVRTNFGLHILKVVEVEPQVVKELEQVRPQIEKVLRSQRAERKLKIDTERLPGRIAKEGIAALAKEKGMKVVSTGWLDGTGDLPKLGSARSLYATIKSRKPGAGAIWRRNPVQGHVFYQIVDKKAAYVKPLEEVRAEVVGALLSEKMAEKALKQAKEDFKDMKTYKDFKGLAARHKFPLKTSEFTVVDGSVPEIGFNRQFQLAAFRLNKDKPIGLSINGKTAHLLFLKKRHIPEGEDEKKAKQLITAEIQTEWAQYFLASRLEQLKAQTDIEVVTPELVSSL